METIDKMNSTVKSDPIVKSEPIVKTATIDKSESIVKTDTLVNSDSHNKLEPKPKKRKQSYNSVMSELLKPPPKEEKPNIHLSGGGQFSKLDKI